MKEDVYVAPPPPPVTNQTSEARPLSARTQERRVKELCAKYKREGEDRLGTMIRLHTAALII